MNLQVFARLILLITKINYPIFTTTDSEISATRRALIFIGKNFDDFNKI